MPLAMSKPTIISLPRMQCSRGTLSFIEAKRHVPFSIERVYWVYDVPGSQTRGGHAFRTQHELIVALSGSFEVVVDTGGQQYTYQLNRAFHGLYIPPLVWRHFAAFATNSLALVLSSADFDEGDYIRDYQEYLLRVRDAGQHADGC